LRTSIEDAGATVTHDEVPTVMSDATQMTQLLQNLIGNAVKFRSPDRPCKIHVGVQQQEDRWVFSVSDNGIGIDPSQLAEIFTLFRRLHTRQQYSGSGISLTICKKIVDRHGGTIWADSHKGAGTTFFFTWPMRPCDLTAVLGESQGFCFLRS
jgi:light-regulated signal transduction histidine kinase (bacteriophytochrome)